MRHRLLAVTAVSLLLAGPACEGLVDPSDNVTTEFSGVVDPGFAVEHSIRITRNGEYSLRVKSLEPSENTFLLIILGLVDQGLCAPIQQNWGFHDQLALAGEMRNVTYCIQVIDPGVLTVPVAYVLELSHP